MAPCEAGSPKQNFTFNATTGFVTHGARCLALNLGDLAGALRLGLSGPCSSFAMANGSTLRTKNGAPPTCIAASPSRPASWPTQLFDLWTGHDAFVPRGIYRIPSMITTKNGTLIVFAQARVHSTDATPSSALIWAQHSSLKTAFYG